VGFRVSSPLLPAISGDSRLLQVVFRSECPYDLLRGLVIKKVLQMGA
jgi:hypothetical protein